jgi:hypothetical protein
MTEFDKEVDIILTNRLIYMYAGRPEVRNGTWEKDMEMLKQSLKQAVAKQLIGEDDTVATSSAKTQAEYYEAVARIARNDLRTEQRQSLWGDKGGSN